MHYGASSTLPPEKVVGRAVEYFGDLGLKVTKRSPSTLVMEGERGMVAITLSLGTETEVDIVAHGLKEQVKAFLQRIG